MVAYPLAGFRTDASGVRVSKLIAESGDYGTNDLLVSQIIRINKLRVWFVAEHLVEVPLVRADAAKVSAR